MGVKDLVDDVVRQDQTVIKKKTKLVTSLNTAHNHQATYYQIVGQSDNID